MNTKKLFFFAIAALGLAACSNDEVVETIATSEANEISFRPLVSGITRSANGAGLKTAWETGDILYVTAQRGTAKYFQDQFVYGDGTVGFNSSNKYYWPSASDLSSNHLVFTAFWGAEQKTWTVDGDGKYLAAAYTVPDAVASQKDLLFAMKEVSVKPESGGVELNFRHMLSQIVVKVANDQSNLDIVITGVRVGFLNKVGTFYYTGGVTDTKTTDASNSGGATLIDKENWTKTDDASKNASYLFEQTVVGGSNTLSGTTAATAISGFTPWILMPQALTAATQYTQAKTPAGSGTGSVDDSSKDLNGAYLALKMQIKDHTTSAVIVGEQWCYWPIGTTWNPGYRYTYTINAGSGGYQPTDQNQTLTDLDPVLDGAVIWFTPSCSIDAWVDSNIGISEPAVAITENVAKGSTKTYDVAAGTHGTYTINVTGLTPGHHVILDPSTNNNFTVNSGPTTDTTVPANGIVTLAGTLAANVDAAVTSTIYLKVYPTTIGTDEVTADKTTITFNQAAATPVP